MLTGNDFIIVGKDALDATKSLYCIGEVEAIQMIAADFGTTSDHIFPVEQPGTFHLDMGMLLVHDKVVLIQKPLGETELLVYKTISDLIGHGFTVIVDEDQTAVGPGFNFLNGEFVRSAEGKIFYLTNGATTTQQKKFEDFFKNNFGYTVLFVPNTFDAAAQGGLGCRVKGYQPST